MFKINNRNTRPRCAICSKSTIKTAERHHWHHSVVLNVNFELLSNLVLQWWKKYFRISHRFKKIQKCPFPLAQCWERHAFLPQVPTSTTFPTLKVGGGGYFSKYFFQGCLKNFLHSNNVCMYFGGKKIALVDFGS